MASSSTNSALGAARSAPSDDISEYRLPDKAIDLIDQASAKLRLAADELRPELEKAIADEDDERAVGEEEIDES